LTSFGDKSATKFTITDFQQSGYICFLFPFINADTGQNSTLIYNLTPQSTFHPFHLVWINMHRHNLKALTLPVTVIVERYNIIKYT
jgi:hypothetical protein